MVVDGLDAILVTGVANGDIWIRRYDATGSTTWTETVTDGPDGVGRGLAIAPGGDLLAVATVSVSNFDDDIWLRRYDTAAVELWTRVLASGADIDLAGGVAADALGRAVVGGAFDLRMWTGTIGPTGTEVWDATVQPGSSSVGLSVATDSSNNVIVAGYWNCCGSSLNEDGRLVKYNAVGEEIWTVTFGDFDGVNDWALGVAVDASDNVVVAGFVGGGSDPQAWVQKLNASGGELWSLSDPVAMAATAVAVDGSGNVVVKGATQASSWVAKYDPEGAKLWEQFPEGTWNGFYGEGVAVDSQGHVVAVGSIDNGTTIDAWIGKFLP